MLPYNSVSELQALLQTKSQNRESFFHKNSQKCELLKLFTKLSENAEQYCQAEEAYRVNKLPAETG